MAQVAAVRFLRRSRDMTCRHSSAAMPVLQSHYFDGVTIVDYNMLFVLLYEEERGCPIPYLRRSRWFLLFMAANASRYCRRNIPVV